MNQLDLLLVNAPARAGVYGNLSGLSAIEPPVWAGLIARYCLARGFTVRILDAEAEGIDAFDTAERILKIEPRLAAFCVYGHQPSASTQCMPGAREVAWRVRASLKGYALRDMPKNISTIAIGTHPSALPQKTLREEPFDFVCQGEGPLTIIALLNALRDGPNFAGVPGLHYRGRLGSKLGGGLVPCANPPAPNIDDLDAELPSQAWELLDMDKYRAHGWHLWTGDPLGGYASVQTSLGCQFKCEFCCIQAPFGTMSNITDLDAELPSQAWELLDMRRYRAHGWHLWGRNKAERGGYASVQTSLGCQFKCEFCCIQAPFGDAGPRMRYWSPENVVEQIVTLVRDYNISNIKIPDEMFCFNRAHVKAICHELIDRGLGDRLNIWAYARVDTVKDEDMLALMRRAGFRWLGMGIESGSKHVRDGVDKGRFGNEQIIAAVRRVQAAGIAVGANYIFGLPDDTPESCQQTLDLACELNTEYANFYCAMAYPGSALHRAARAKGWRLPEDPGGPGWIGYSQHAPESLPLRTEAMTAEEVLDFRDEAFLRYFTRPEYLEMMRAKFGDSVVEEIQAMTAVGKPRRLHREK